MLTSAPIQMQIAAGIGFLSYLVATAGLRERHRPVEITGWTLAFSAVFLATLPVMQAAVSERWSMWISAGVPIMIAGLWRYRGHRLASWVGAKLKISRAMQYPSVESWIADHHPRITQIGVVLKDGTEISCMNADEHWDGEFKASMLFAPDGIALHADTIVRPGKEPKKYTYQHLHDANWGSRITVIPKDQIAWYWLRAEKS